MTHIQSVALAAELAAVLTAIMLARRRAEHTSAAVALVAFFAIDLARLPLVAAHGSPAGAPWEGAAVLVWLDGAAVMLQQSVLPALTLAACSPAGRRIRSAAPIVIAYALAAVALAAIYPSPLVRGAGLQRAYLLADLVGLFVTVATFAVWASKRLAPSTSHGVALLLAALDVAILLSPLSPWSVGLFGRYDPAEMALLVWFSVLATIQGVLCRRTS